MQKDVIELLSKVIDGIVFKNMPKDVWEKACKICHKNDKHYLDFNIDNDYCKNQSDFED